MLFGRCFLGRVVLWMRERSGGFQEERLAMVTTGLLLDLHCRIGDFAFVFVVKGEGSVTELIFNTRNNLRLLGLIHHEAFLYIARLGQPHQVRFYGHGMYDLQRRLLSEVTGTGDVSYRGYSIPEE